MESASLPGVGATLSALARAIEAGDLTSEEIVRRCLERIAARESAIHAWRHLDADHALEQARQRDREPRRGPLHGLPLGIKDIFDTADMPTEYGSRAYAGHRPKRDAGCVRLLREAGAVILGKTVTTEFAGFVPAETANPHAPAHTPGGSSSGSAAAVADGMVPAATGTQTMGSIIRPAAFCGVVGFKPSFGLLPLDGVKRSAESLDTAGVIARDADDLPLLMAALAPGRYREAAPGRAPRIALVRAPIWDKARPETSAALENAARSLRDGGAALYDAGAPPCVEALHESAWTILRFENARNFAREHRECRRLLSPAMAAFLDDAAAVDESEYVEAQMRAAEARADLDRLLESCNAILTAATTGEAPLGLGSTGDSVFNAAWTLGRGPCLTLPATKGPRGLPVGIQLVGRRGRDGALVAVARWAAARLAA